MRRETHDKLRRAQDLLRHAIPSGDVAEILDRALTLLVADLERRRLRPTGHATLLLSQAVAVGTYQRRSGAPCGDGIRVAARSLAAAAGARRRAFWSFTNVEPYATGGSATIENIQLRCKAHNLYEAALFFGDGGDCVREFTAEWWRGVVLNLDGCELTT